MPCKNRLKFLELTPKKWIMGKAHYHTLDLYVERMWGDKPLICGPYWKPLIRMFDIQLGDIVCFTLVVENVEDAMEVDEQGEEEEDIEEEQNEDMNTFQITVYSVVDNEKEQKNFVAPAGDFWNCTYFK